MGDDFRFVSVFCAELGSTADTCGASVYEAFRKNFTLFLCFLMLSPYSALSLVRQRIHVCICLRSSGRSPYSALCLVQQRIQVHRQTIEAGFAVDSAPRAVFLPVVRPKMRCIMAVMDQKESLLAVACLGWYCWYFTLHAVFLVAVHRP